MSAVPIRESSAGAEAAQAQLLYERYARQVHRFCRSRLRSPEEAEDAVQHTFLNAYRSLRSGTVPRAEAAWVFAIAANVCRERMRSALRRSRIEVVSDDGLVGETQAAPEHSHDELEGVADALAELAPNQRRAILMREWQGLSYKEIAAELSVTEAAVETLLFRARRSLARKLDRSRAWGLANLGSLLAWGKSVLAGTGAQVAAATLVVSAGVATAVPAFTHATPSVQAAPVQRVVASAPASFVPRRAQAVVSQAARTQARTTRVAPRTARHGLARAAAPAAAQARVQAPGAPPTPAATTAPPAQSQPVAASTPSLPVSTPAVPPPPPVPPVSLPSVPPVTVPPVTVTVPPVSLPQLPVVQLPTVQLPPVQLPPVTLP
jgi:RNA polymerase sigma-70 factor (ECF subfamily)